MRLQLPISKELKTIATTFCKSRREKHKRIKDIRALLQQLNKKKYYDTSCPIGTAYHSVPFPAINPKVYRNDTKKRSSLIKKHYDVLKKKGLDIGCALGGISFKLARSGALMTGIDINSEEIEIARKIEDMYRAGCFFYCEDAKSFIDQGDHLKNYDFAIWFSQWMWLVKQHGLDSGKKALFNLSTEIDTLFFENSIGDAAAGDTMQRHGITSVLAVENLLRECTLYNSITLINKGPWSARVRPIFYCHKDASIKAHGLTSDTTRVGLEAVKKSVMHNSALLENEIQTLRRLKGPHFPKVISTERDSLIMTYQGQPLTRRNMPDNHKEQCEEILKSLEEADILHRDINPTNLLVKGGVISLVDFGYAGRISKHLDKELPNSRNNLPAQLGFRTFRRGDHYDDRFSLNISIKYILNTPEWLRDWNPEDHY